MSSSAPAPGASAPAPDSEGTGPVPAPSAPVPVPVPGTSPPDASPASATPAPATAGPGRTAPATRARSPHPLDIEAGRTGIITVLMAATLLRFWQLGKVGLWIDEGWTWTTASLPLPKLLQRSVTDDASPPLYSLLTSLALRLGDTEAHLRLVSVIASVGLVWVTYRFARLLANRTTSTLAAGLTALSAYQIQYAQEARAYVTVGFLTVLALYLFARAVMLGRRHAWLPYIVVSTLALYTQGIALLGSAVQAVAIVTTHAGRRHGKYWAMAQAVIFVLFLPWMVVSLQQAAAVGSSHWYLHPPTLHSAFLVLRSLFVSPLPIVSAMPGTNFPGLDQFAPRWLLHTILVMAPAVPLFGALSLIRERSRRGRLVRLMTASLFLPLIGVLVMSFEMPLWLPRYFPFLTPFVSVLTAVGIARLRPRIAIGWTALLFLIAGYTDFRYFNHYSKEPWREVAQSIASRSTPGRSLVMVMFDADALWYYNARLPGGAPPVLEMSHAQVPFSDFFTAAQVLEMERAARLQARKYSEVWLVSRNPESPPREIVYERTQRVAGEGRVLAVRERWESFQGPLYVWCWRRPERPVSQRPASPMPG